MLLEGCSPISPLHLAGTEMIGLLQADIQVEGNLDPLK